MSDSEKTKKQLIEELESLRQRNAILEAATTSTLPTPEPPARTPQAGAVDYQQVFDRSPLGVFQYDHNLQIIDCNERFVQILQSSRERLIGLDLRRLRDQSLRPTLEAVLAGEEGLYEGPYAATTSTVRLWIKLHTAPLTQTPGESRGGVGLIEDITQRQQAEQTLRESEQRFHDIVTNMVGWVWEVNAQGQYTYCSERVTEILGYPIEEVLGKTPFDFMLPAEAARLAPWFGEIITRKANIPEVENWNRRQDGTHVCLVTSGVAILDEAGNLTGYRGVDTDITERKLAEETLRASEERLDAAVRGTNIALWDWDIETGQILFNERWAEIIGYTLAELEPTSIETWSQFTHPDDLEKSGQLLARHFAGETPYYECETRMKHKNGAWVWVQNRGRVTKWGENGRPWRMVGTQADITERKHIEAERERFTTRLRTAAYIAEQVGAILDPNELLQTVIALIKEQFGLYYAHIYTLDKATATLNLRAGYGEPGRVMLERGHSIPLDREQSLVATAARTHEVVLVQDVTENPYFMPNPLLPDTQTEVAVPIIARGEMLGVFDVQHDIPHYFTDADLDVFQTLAAQVANAFQSAALYEQVQQQRTLYDGILQHLPVGVWAVDNHFNILLVNDAGRAMMGREIQAQDGGAYVETYEVINLDTGALYDNAQLPLVKAVTQGGTHTATNAGVRRPDGGVVPMLINAGPLLDPQGNQMGGVVIFADASAQRHAQAEIERLLAETRIRLDVNETLSEAHTEAAVLDAMVKVADFYPQAQILITLVKEHADQPVFHAVRSELFTSGIPPVLQAGMQFSAAEFPLLNHLSAKADFISNEVFADDRFDPGSLAFGEQMGVHSFAMFPLVVGAEWFGTLTVAAQAPGFFDEHSIYLYRALAEHGAAALQAARLRTALQTSVARFEGFAENTSYGFGMAELDGTIVYVNTAFSQILGEVNAQAMVGQPIPRYIPEDLHAFFDTHIMPTLMQSERWSGELALLTVDGKRIPTQENYFVIRDAQGNPRYLADIVTDITDRKTAEARIAEQLFILESSPDFIGAALPNGKGTYINPAGLQMTGYTETEFYETMKIGDFQPDLPPDAITTAITQGVWYGETTLATKDGRRIPVSQFIGVRKDAAGNVLGLYTIARDITDRLTAEREVRTSRQMLQGVIDNLPESIFWKDKDLVYLGCNTRFAYDTGFASAAEVVGKTDFDMPWREQAELYREDDRRVIMSGTPKLNYEEPQTTPTGDTIWLRTNKVPLYDAEGHIYAVLGAYADITAIIEAQAERTRLSMILEATTDFVAIGHAEDGRAIYLNRGAREMIGIPMSAAPHEYTIPMFVPEAELPRVMNEIVPTATQKGIWSGESFLRAFDGREIPTLMTIIAIKNAAGDLQYLANVSRDITALKQAEAARARFTTQLNTAAQIAAQITTILDPDELFETVIPLMKERFDLYHVHFYGLEKDALVLRAGYGRVGKIMKQQGFTIPLHREKSLVVRAARSREIVWVNDVTQEEGYLPNLLLPNTKSEVAVPAMIGDEVLGVLDVQSDEVGAFSAADLDVFRTLVGQIATAFQNARAFEHQRRVEMAERDVAERVRAIFEVMSEGITVTNTLGQIEDLNEATLRLHGYAGREEVLGRSAMELFARADWGRASQGIRQALESGRSGTAEYKMVRQNGEWFDAEQNSALLRDAVGAPAGFVSITRDITERKRAEEALQLTRASVDATAAEIFWFNETGEFTDANATACEMLGYTRAELLTMSIFDVDRDFPRTALPAVLAQVRQTGSITLSSRHRTKDGRTFPVEIHAYSVQFGEQIQYFVFAQDITDRLQAEAERERFTTQLRTAAEVSTQVGAILDPQQLLELVVPLVAERFDLYHVHVYTLDEETQMLALRVGSGEAGRLMQAKGHAIPLDNAQSLVARAARSRRAVLVNDISKSPDFLPNPLLPDTRAELVVPLLVADRLLGVLDVQDDETDRFTTGDLDVFTTLAGQIAAAFLTATSYERVLEIDRLKGEFLANMSHELRTPMNSILGYTEVMLMGIDGELTPEMEEDVQAIFENGQQLLRLINDILDLTKIEAGRMTLNKELVDLLPVLEDSRVNNLGLLHKRKTEVDIVLDTDEDLPFIMADRVRLGQVLNNLVSNAVKFTEKGFIYLRAHQIGKQVIIEVEDTGIGMSKEDQGKIFERFRQVDGSSTRRAEGTGLGLAISRSLVQMHGWEMKLTSELKKGSKFSIYIPVEDDNMEAG